jgi:hypothetical protein
VFPSISGPVDGQYQTRAEVENIVAGHGMGGRDRRGRDQQSGNGGSRGDYYGPPADSMGGYGAVSSGASAGYYDQQQSQYASQGPAVASSYGGYGAAIDAYAAASAAAATTAAAATGQGRIRIG